jgi:hypothetical protein
VLLVAQDAVRVEHFARQPDGLWLLSDAATPGSTVELPAIGCRLALARLYDKLDL